MIYLLRVVINELTLLDLFCFCAKTVENGLFLDLMIESLVYSSNIWILALFLSLDSFSSYLSVFYAIL